MPHCFWANIAWLAAITVMIFFWFPRGITIGPTVLLVSADNTLEKANYR